MNIVIFQQPFPMGNYKLNQYIGNKLSLQGHTVNNFSQISCNEINKTTNDIIQKYIQHIESLNPDILYFEMLDICTFKVVEHFSCKKILCHASRGVLDSYDDLVNYKDQWFTSVMSNSKDFVKKHKDTIDIDHWCYYPAPIYDNEIRFDKHYQWDICFVGQGHHRQKSKDYEKERNVFFNGSGLLKAIYGDGWKHQQGYKGLLPPNDLGSLYKSSNTAFALISKSQREMGQINNRYSEIAHCEGTCISLDYGIDWFGAEKFIKFVDSFFDVYQASIKKYDPNIKFKEFILNQETIFFELLNEHLKK